MYLSVVLSRLLLEEEISSSQRFQISRNAEGVGAMRLGQAKSNALVLRQIAVGVLDRQFRVRLAYPKSRRKTPRNPVGSRSFKLKVRETHGLFLLTSIVHL